jgi:hypothetical protein
MSTFSFIATPLIIILLIGGALILFAVMKKRDQRLKIELENTLKSQGITRWKGPAQESDLKNSLLIGKSYIQDLYVYPDQLQLGRATFSFHDLAILVDFASYPFARFPHQRLFIDSKENDMLGRSRIDMTTASRELKLVKLEGNFPDKFEVWYEENKQIEALTLLNPASMVKLMDYFDKYDIEIADNRIYIYQIADFNFFNPAKRQETTDSVRRLAELLNK